MKLIVDDARMERIRSIYEYFPVEGVTTNPSILAIAGRPPFEVLREIRAFLGGEAELHVQVVAGDAEGMQRDAQRIVEILGDGTFVKVPCVPEGFKAMKQLCREGIRVTATAVYTPMQAFLAGSCGASYAAPYINRIDNLGYDGVQTAKTIHDIFQKNGLPTQVLAASFKNSQQVLELCAYGVGAATIAPEVIEGLVSSPVITAAVEGFTADFERLAGQGRTMSDCE